MALRAGYVGVKKSLIDVIKSLASSVIIKEVGDGLEYDDDTGELSVISSSAFDIKLLLHETNGVEKSVDVTVQGLSDYDVILISTWQPSDGGDSDGRKTLNFVFTKFTFPQTFYFYSQRNLTLTIKKDINAINYTGAAPNEAGGYTPTIYDIYGIKF